MISLVNQLKAGFDAIFQKAKGTVTRRRVTKSWNADDDLVESTYTDVSVEGVIQLVELEDVEEYGGLLQVGDAVGFFASGTDVQKGDQIQHNSIWYEIDRIIPEYTEGTLIFNHILMKRKQY